MKIEDVTMKVFECHPFPQIFLLLFLGSFLFPFFPPVRQTTDRIGNRIFIFMVCLSVLPAALLIIPLVP